MTEEEIKALQEAKEAAEKSAAEAKAAAEAATSEAEKAKGDLSNVVEELKDVRAKKAEAEGKAQFNNTEPGSNPDVSEIVKQELSKAEQARVQKEIDDAVNEFKNSKTEFQSDPSGIVYDKFKKELSKFNFTDIASKEEAKNRLEEAYRFVRQTNPDSFGTPEHDGTPRTPSTPKGEDGKLPSNVSSTLESTGVSEEKYRKLSDKYSEALESLGFGA